MHSASFSLALKVIPSHSYALLEIHDNLIPGNPSLIAHGPIQAVSGGGLRLNGESTWIDGHFKSTDCLIDPGLCEDGFSIAGKFMFEESAKSYTDARYVLDTGAHGGTSRGISVYLKNGKLHFQLTTSSKTWTVSQLPWIYHDISMIGDVLHFSETEFKCLPINAMLNTSSIRNKGLPYTYIEIACYVYT